MCDYSLHHVASTPAKVDDRLVATVFSMTSTRGFCAEGKPGVAVCLLPGTELAFDAEVECDRALGFLPSRKIHATVARFRQVDVDEPYAHHDALEFPDGQIVLVTHLKPGQRATVLQLPAEPVERRETAPERARGTTTTAQPETPVYPFPV